MDRKPILVTGGCGFVGRHLVAKLLGRGDSVWIVDNLFTGKHPDAWLRGFEKTPERGYLRYVRGPTEVVFIERDALDFFLDELKDRPSVPLPKFSDVFHLASIVGGRALIDGDPILVATDLAIDSLLFLWATRKKGCVERILYASSSAAYPIHLQTHERKVALKEDFIHFGEQLGLPDMTYGWSKVSGEYLGKFVAHRYGIPVASVRPFSGYGEDQDLTYPVPAIAARVARRENPIEVWGTGDQGRDFVHIDDCIDAMLLALEKISDGSGVNIGSGKLTSFREVIALLGKLEGYAPDIKCLLDKPVGVQARHAHMERISSFGWRPTISLEEGMRRVLQAARQRVKK